jgi:hypothetical protein
MADERVRKPTPKASPDTESRVVEDPGSESETKIATPLSVSESEPPPPSKASPADPQDPLCSYAEFASQVMLEPFWQGALLHAAGGYSRPLSAWKKALAKLKE